MLYGSQTGNSEQAAIDLAEKAPAKLSNDEVAVTARHMQLDDFLEKDEAEVSHVTAHNRQPADAT